MPSFLGIFIYPPFERGSSEQLAYYILLPAIFNVGWAFVQISNMAFLNSITYSTQRRDRLISLRNGFTYVANLTVLSFALGLFALINDEILQFRVLSLIIVVIGSISSIIYIVTLKEPKLAKEAKRLQKEFLKNQADL